MTLTSPTSKFSRGSSVTFFRRSPMHLSSSFPGDMPLKPSRSTPHSHPNVEMLGPESKVMQRKAEHKSWLSMTNGCQWLLATSCNSVSQGLCFECCFHCCLWPCNTRIIESHDQWSSVNLWPTECHAAKIENNCDPSCHCHYSANAFRNTLLLQKDKLVDLLEARGAREELVARSAVKYKA